MNTVAKVAVECVAHIIEGRRLHRFVREHGVCFAVEHAEEWKRFATDNWAGRLLKKPPSRSLS